MDHRLNKALKNLESWNWLIRKTSCKVLGEIADPSVLQPLIKSIKDKNKYVRRSAVKPLGEIPKEQ
ncbi:MAG: HEAT repeat domain-containing protein [Desulfobacterales bacterium]|nr:HEAT repeat domain-containing protein [Desulfobacterales bacterium]